MTAPTMRTRPSAPAALAAALALGACATTAPTPPLQDPYYGPVVQSSPFREELVPVPFQLDVHLGQRRLDDTAAWDPVEDQWDVGATVRTPIPGSRHFGFDLGGRYAWDEAERGTASIEAQVVELDAGLVASLVGPGELVQPYVGAGLALLFVDNEVTRDPGDRTRNRDAVLGHYVRAGIAVEFSPAQLIGIEVRYLGGEDATLDDASAPIEAITVGLTFGARF